MSIVGKDAPPVKFVKATFVPSAEQVPEFAKAAITTSALLVTTLSSFFPMLTCDSDNQGNFILRSTAVIMAVGATVLALEGRLDSLPAWMPHVSVSASIATAVSGGSIAVLSAYCIGAASLASLAKYVITKLTSNSTNSAKLIAQDLANKINLLYLAKASTLFLATLAMGHYITVSPFYSLLFVGIIGLCGFNFFDKIKTDFSSFQHRIVHFVEDKTYELLNYQPPTKEE